MQAYRQYELQKSRQPHQLAAVFLTKPRLVEFVLIVVDVSRGFDPVYVRTCRQASAEGLQALQQVANNQDIWQMHQADMKPSETWICVNTTHLATWIHLGRQD
jgi:hypothetical protein